MTTPMFCASVLGGAPYLALVGTLTGCGYLLVTAFPALVDAGSAAPHSGAGR